MPRASSTGSAVGSASRLLAASAAWRRRRSLAISAPDPRSAWPSWRGRSSFSPSTRTEDRGGSPMRRPGNGAHQLAARSGMRVEAPALLAGAPALIGIAIGVGRNLARMDADVAQGAVIERGKDAHGGAPPLPDPIGLPGPGQALAEPRAGAANGPACGRNDMRGRWRF